MSAPSVRVLLVEDSLPNARLLQKQLARIGLLSLEITHVKGLEEALAHLNSQIYDIAIIEISTCDINWIRAIRHLQYKNPQIPIVGMVGKGADPAEMDNLQERIPELIVEKRRDSQAIGRAIRYAIQQKRSESALRESEERFRVACEASHAMVYDVDALTGCIVFIHGLFLLLGYNPEDEPQNQEWWFGRIHPDDRPEVLCQLKEAQFKGSDYFLQYRVCHKDGHYIDVEDSGRFILDAMGHMVRIVGSILDITQRKKAEDALRQSEQRYHNLVEELEQMVAQRTADLKQRRLEVRAMAAELTHAEERERKRLAQVLHDDLQQLLAGVKFCAESLVGNIQDGHRETVLRLTQLLDESIESTRSLAFELSPPILHNSGLAKSLQELGRRMETKHGLSVKVTVDKEAEPEATDLRVLLFQATRELLFNVVKHARVKTAEVEMRLFKEHYVQIIVADSGVGFDPENGDKDDSRQGFGLFSIQGRLDLIGGELDIRSAPGSGSRCIITAPLDCFVAPERMAYRTARKLMPRSKPRGGLMRTDRKIRVMIADDHANMRRGLTRLLQGHKDMVVVGEATDGHEILDVARQISPDVIVMEANMHGLNGIETTSRLKEEFPRIRVIGFSAGEELEQSAAMCKAGAFAFLNNSNHLKSLVATIRDSFAGAA